MEKLFETEKQDLLGDLKSLPRHSAIRKVSMTFFSLLAPSLFSKISPFSTDFFISHPLTYRKN